MASTIKYNWINDYTIEIDYQIDAGDLAEAQDSGHSGLYFTLTNNLEDITLYSKFWDTAGGDIINYTIGPSYTGGISANIGTLGNYEDKYSSIGTSIDIEPLSLELTIYVRDEDGMDITPTISMEYDGYEYVGYYTLPTFSNSWGLDGESYTEDESYFIGGATIEIRGTLSMGYLSGSIFQYEEDGSVAVTREFYSSDISFVPMTIVFNYEINPNGGYVDGSESTESYSIDVPRNGTLVILDLDSKVSHEEYYELDGWYYVPEGVSGQFISGTNYSIAYDGSQFNLLVDDMFISDISPSTPTSFIASWAYNGTEFIHLISNDAELPTEGFYSDLLLTFQSESSEGTSVEAYYEVYEGDKITLVNSHCFGDWAYGGSETSMTFTPEASVGQWVLVKIYANEVVVLTSELIQKITNPNETPTFGTITLSPNPFTDSITISWEDCNFNNPNNEYTIWLYSADLDELGTIYTISTGTNSGTIVINESDYPSYFTYEGLCAQMVIGGEDTLYSDYSNIVYKYVPPATTKAFTPYIYINGEYKQVTQYVYRNGQWT